MTGAEIHGDRVMVKKMVVSCARGYFLLLPCQDSVRARVLSGTGALISLQQQLCGPYFRLRWSSIFDRS